MNQAFQKVAYIGLRSEDGGYFMNVPLYVKVSEVTKYGVTKQQEDLVHKISNIMMKQYEGQIYEKFFKKQKRENVNENF